MSVSLAGRTAIVTGAAQGIGRAIAEALVSAGANVLIADIKPAGARTAREIAAQGPGACEFIEADISNTVGVAAVVERAISRFGSIDILCPNAAVFRRSLTVDMEEAEWDAVFNGGLRAVFLIVKACLPKMLEQKRGRIVITGSITGARVGQLFHAHYGASKAGMVGFARCVALEVALHNITVNVIEPGNIMTDAMRAMPENTQQQYIDHIPMNRMGEAEEVASLVRFLASDDARYITGQEFVIDGGQILPENLPLPRPT
jgi:3-oxoacyl-[acyl-carrier protein] reductase